MNNSNLHMRLARMEAMTNYQKSELPQTVEQAYKIACDKQDIEEAAYYARKIRDRLLNESDKEMSVDRMDIEIPENSNFSSWLTFLQSFVNFFTSEWAQYRKALRDLPEQEGFPFNIELPEKPANITPVEEVSECDE